jgi:hypothetical protein
MSAAEAPVIRDHADLLYTILKAEDAITPQLEELDAVFEILDAPAWTAADLELNPNLPGDAANHSRLDVCCIELKRRNLVGYSYILNRGVSQFMGYNGTSRNVLQDSPFWHCVAEAKREAVYCLQVQEGIIRMSVGNGPMQEFAPQPLIANTALARARVPSHFTSAERQVLVAYNLVTLLYATFNIPVPDVEDTPLWFDLPVYEFSGNQNHWLASAWLDRSTALPDGSSKDKYGLKPRLRADRFDIHDVGWPDPGHAEHRTQWTPATRMPWLQVLRELVGYTKYAESLVPADRRPAASVLVETAAYCTRQRQHLQERLARRGDDLTLATHALAKSKFEQEPGTQKKTAKLRLLHARMHSLINT